MGDWDQTPTALKRSGIWWRVAATVLVGCGCSFFIWSALQRRENRLIQARFELRATERAQSVQREIDADVGVLHAVASFFAGSREVEQDEFTTFCQPLLRHHRSLFAIEWAPRVLLHDREKLEHELRNRAHVKNGVFRSGNDAGIAGQRFPVKYAVQAEAVGSHMLGFDHALDRPRWEAMEVARDFAKPVATERLDLIRLKGRAAGRHGLLIVMPVYKKGAPISSVPQRRRHLSGFVIGVLRMTDVVDCALRELSPAGIDFILIDQAVAPDRRVLHTHLSRMRDYDDEPSFVDSETTRRWAKSIPISVAGRQWYMTAQPTAEFVASRNSALPDLILTAGLLLTGLTSAYVSLIVGRDAQIKKQVARRTAEFRSMNEQLISAMTELDNLSRHDALTGLWNRHCLTKELDREWERAGKRQTPFACVLLDADYFKNINDTFGHAAGDQVLRVIAEILRASCSGSARVGRYGGEEFCALLPNINEQGATQWAETVRQRFEEQVVTFGSESIRFTASFGVAERLIDTSSPNELINHADQALRVAKQLGRNQVVAFSELSRVGHAHDSNLISMLGTATAQDVMIPLVGHLLDSDSLAVALGMFLQTHLDSLPVLSGDGRLAGLLAEEDLTAHLLVSGDLSQKISEILNRKTVCYDQQDPASQIAEFLSRAAVRRVLVMQDRQPVGTISRRSLLHWIHFSSYANSMRGDSEDHNSTFNAYSKAGLLAVIDQLQAEAIRLRQDLEQSMESASPIVIGSVSRMQLLIEESLAYMHASDTYPDSERRTLVQLLA